jgi:hypothetical protein
MAACRSGNAGLLRLPLGEPFSGHLYGMGFATSTAVSPRKPTMAQMRIRHYLISVLSTVFSGNFIGSNYAIFVGLADVVTKTIPIPLRDLHGVKIPLLHVVIKVYVPLKYLCLCLVSKYCPDATIRILARMDDIDFSHGGGAGDAQLF